MTEPSNIGPPRDTMAAEDCEFGLRLLLMNQRGWPIPNGCAGQTVMWWPTLKSYQWMRQFEGGKDDQSQVR